METNIRNKCKACTSLEQSKKLAEILPIESADLHYVRQTHDFRGNTVDGKWSNPKYGNPNSRYANYIVQNFSSYETIPCWSLAALLSVLPSVIKRKGKRMFLTLEKAGAYNLYYRSPDRLDELWETKEDVIDACYEMIINLHELKLL